MICHDADSNAPSDILERVLASIVRPSGKESECCVIVPVQEIEAWIIADETAVNAVIPSFRFKGHRQPEKIVSPKEWLIKQSEAANGKPLYSPKTFNAAVSKRLRLDVVQKKCPSFKNFVDCLNKKLKLD